MTRSLGWRPITVFVLSIIGLGLSIFLTWGHYFDQAAITRSCAGAFGGVSHGLVDCGAVTTSKWSMVLGIPVAVYGLVFFVFMTTINAPRFWRTPSQIVARLRLAASVAGVIGVLYLVGVEALAVHAICIYCTGVHVASFVIFLLVVTGWEDTGWARFVAAYDAEQAEQAGLEDSRASDEKLDEPVAEVTGGPVLNGRAPRPSRSERKRAGASR